MDVIIEEFNLGSDISFQHLFSSDEVNDTLFYYSRYQQLYKGIIVEGGGFTAEYIKTFTPDPDGPCDFLYSISPRILTGIDIDTTPNISPYTAITFPNDTIYSTDLIITHNILNDCKCRLTWKIYYNYEGNKLTYVDANTGDSLTTCQIDDNINIKAPTLTYDDVYFDNYKTGNLTQLKSLDQRIKVLDFNTSSPYDASTENYLNWKHKSSPETTNDDEWTTEATKLAYQAFYVTDLVLPKFDELGIGDGFTAVRVGTYEEYDNSKAYNFPGADDIQSILLGGSAGSGGDGATALFDIVAHELTHIYLRNFLSSEKKPAGSLHEGLCDIFGTFIESQIQGIDWIIGDDDQSTADDYDRDLENPGSNYDCFDEVKNNTTSHERGKPLGYWYYLISEGKMSPVISALGLDKAIEIVLASLKNLSDLSDYKDLMNSTVSYVLKKYGRCSDEFRAVTQAWELICVETGHASNGIIPACTFDACITEQLICEEHEEFEVCACGTYPENTGFNWTIIGSKSTEFTSIYGMQGNSQVGGSCLQITDIPKYPYYPQYLRIRLHSPTFCNAGIRPCIFEKIVKINDCGNDDPHCDDIMPLKHASNEHIIKHDVLNSKFIDNENSWTKLIIYDMYGRIILETTKDLQTNMETYGLAFYIYYDKNGKIVKANKYFNFVKP